MGYYTDPETGLLLLTHRYYDPSEGRFLNRDPIGYAGGMNLYGYVGANPANGLDPLGLYYDDFSGYLGEVGQVFCGYGAVLNPVNWYNGASGLYDIASSKGIGAAGKALGHGFVTGLQFWGTTDPREFGQRFGGDLMLAAAAAAPFAETGAAAGAAGEAAAASRPVSLMYGIRLAKQLASEQQMAEMTGGLGKVIIPGSRLRDLGRLLAEYGGSPEGWAKMSSSTYRAADGSVHSIHWYQNLRTGLQVEPKTVFDYRVNTGVLK